MFFYTIITDIVFVCFIFSMVLLLNRKSGWYFHFTWFLLLTFLVELSGYLTYFVFHYSNHRIFNYFMPVEFYFIGWVMYKVFLPLFNGKRLIGSMLAIFSVIYLWEGFRSGFTEYSTLANIVFSVSMVIICLMYYYYLIKSEEYIDVFRHADFWIVTGLFIFYFVETASNFFFNYTASINGKTIFPVRYIIHIVLNFILYASWVYAFLCQYRKRISSSL